MKISYKDIIIDWKEEVDFKDTLATYVVLLGDKAIEQIDNYRKSLGFTDAAGSSDNDVYYNGYLEYDLDTQKINFYVVVNNSEKDDFIQYDFKVDITENDLISILTQTIKEVMDIV